ncbi:hypothetical protein [Suttonella ornithocola]|uniref:Uncharacterized protein n=1 Tax=Suttonella ornithocola TaxID=279832 RepID=A0A380MQ08_9GAMM|nr:hypothetical protein [Suttonella ornithocola]SUO94146.1 Uncharacterised protein [Suttonella ornithocola]
MDYYLSKNCSNICDYNQYKDEINEITKFYYNKIKYELELINRKNISLYKGKANFFSHSKNPSYFIIAFGWDEDKKIIIILDI